LETGKVMVSNTWEAATARTNDHELALLGQRGAGRKTVRS
jgi:hypothetical protein